VGKHEPHQTGQRKEDVKDDMRTRGQNGVKVGESTNRRRMAQEIIRSGHWPREIIVMGHWPREIIKGVVGLGKQPGHQG